MRAEIHIDLGEDILEATVVLLQDGVLGREVQRIVSLEGVLEGGVSKVSDGLVSIVHGERHSGSFELERII